MDLAARTLFFAFGPGTTEMIVIGIIGLLLFGRRLPEVGRSLGKTFFELKRGMNDIRHEFEDVDRLAEEAARDEARDRRAREREWEERDMEAPDPHAFLRRDEEIVREAQAFGEDVVDPDQADRETPPDEDRPRS